MDRVQLRIDLEIMRSVNFWMEANTQEGKHVRGAIRERIKELEVRLEIPRGDRSYIPEKIEPSSLLVTIKILLRKLQRRNQMSLRKFEEAQWDSEVIQIVTNRIVTDMRYLYELKQKNPIHRVEVNYACVGSILNGYREGDLTFEEAKDLLTVKENSDD